MIGWIEIIFATIITSLIWLVIFKIMIKWGKKKMFDNMLGKIEKQDKTIINGGKPFDINEMMKKAGELMAAANEENNSPTSSEGEAEVNEPKKDSEGKDFSGSDVPLPSPSGDDKEKEVKKK